MYYYNGYNFFHILEDKFLSGQGLMFGSMRFRQRDRRETKANNKTRLTWLHWFAVEMLQQEQAMPEKSDSKNHQRRVGLVSRDSQYPFRFKT